MIVILIGTGLRLFRLGYQSLWFDESISLVIARTLAIPQILANVVRSSHPPFYSLLLHAWVQAAGTSDYSARFLSAAGSLLSVPLIYRIGRSLFDRKVGLWAALLLAVQPFQIQYAQEARMYALLLFLTLVTLLAFTRAMRTGSFRWWSVYLSSFILALYTHYFIGFTVLTYHLFAAVYLRRYRRMWPAILTADVIALIAFLPQLRMFFRELDVVVGNYWLATPSLVSALTTVYFLTFGAYQRKLLVIYTSLFAIFALLAVGLYEVFARKTDKASFRWQILLVMGAFVPIILVFIISQIESIYLNRTLIICTPFLTLLLAIILRRTHSRSPVPYLAIVTSVCVIVVFWGIYITPSATKEPLREAAEYIWQNKESDDLVIHLTQWTALPFTCYSPPAENYLLLGNPYPLKPLDVWEMFGRTIAVDSIAADQRLWLVVIPSQTRDFQREQLQQLGASRAILLEDRVGDIVIRLYERAD
jgi:uncharacterized membrane protein